MVSNCLEWLGQFKAQEMTSFFFVFTFQVNEQTHSTSPSSPRDSIKGIIKFRWRRRRRKLETYEIFEWNSSNPLIISREKVQQFSVNSKYSNYYSFDWKIFKATTKSREKFRATKNPRSWNFMELWEKVRGSILLASSLRKGKKKKTIFALRRVQENAKGSSSLRFPRSPLVQSESVLSVESSGIAEDSHPKREKQKFLVARDLPTCTSWLPMLDFDGSSSSKNILQQSGIELSLCATSLPEYSANHHHHHKKRFIDFSSFSVLEKFACIFFGILQQFFFIDPSIFCTFSLDFFTIFSHFLV